LSSVYYQWKYAVSGSPNSISITVYHCLIHLSGYLIDIQARSTYTPFIEKQCLSIFIDETMKAALESGKKNEFTHFFLRREIIISMDYKMNLTDGIVKLLNDKKDNNRGVSV